MTSRLTAIEERLDTLTRVIRRHGSLEAALIELERAAALVASVDGESGAIGSLEAAADARRSAGGQRRLPRSARCGRRRRGASSAPSPRSSGRWSCRTRAFA